jgi:hypothetical protein
MPKEGKKTSEEMTLEETYKLKRDIESYIERWESVEPEEDPLLKSWKKHIDESKVEIKEKKGK